MNRKNTLRTIALGLILTAMASLAPKASASNEGLETLYKVQVKYWFFDTDYYKWETFFETTDPSEAISVYLLMQSVKDDGNLQLVAPNAYWRFIPVDVQLISTKRLKPQIGASKTNVRYGLGR